MEIIIEVLKQSVVVCTFVFATMLLIDFINVITGGDMSRFVRRSNWRQYVGTSIIGVIPGCFGAFTNAALYTRGLISFGAIVGGMVATSGDEAFVMLAMFPQKAIILFSVLFVLGVFLGWLTDKLVPFFKIKPCETCDQGSLHKEDVKVERFGRFEFTMRRFILLASAILLLWTVYANIIGGEEGGVEKYILIAFIIFILIVAVLTKEHYIKEHIYRHILAKHLFKVFLWTFFSLLIIQAGLNLFNLEAVVKHNMLWVFPIAAVLGLIPESGPHMVFTVMFASGMIPFSVLLASSIVQDGHGMLPVFAFSVKDALLIKAFNLVFGLGLGLLLFSLGF